MKFSCYDISHNPKPKNVIKLFLLLKTCLNTLNVIIAQTPTLRRYLLLPASQRRKRKSNNHQEPRNLPRLSKKSKPRSRILPKLQNLKNLPKLNRWCLRSPPKQTSHPNCRRKPNLKSRRPRLNLNSRPNLRASRKYRRD